MDQSQQERKVYLYYGFIRIDKRYESKSYGRDNMYAVGCDWFNFYKNQKVIVFDGFKEECVSLSFMRSIMSRSEMTVQTKSGPIDLKHEVTIIISYVYPNRWYSLEEVEQQLLIRGFDEIIFFWSFKHQIKIDKQDFIDNATLWDTKHPKFDKKTLKQHIQKTYNYQFSG